MWFTWFFALKQQNHLFINLAVFYTGTLVFLLTACTQRYTHRNRQNNLKEFFSDIPSEKNVRKKFHLNCAQFILHYFKWEQQQRNKKV